MVKVLISDKMSPRAAEIFRARGVDVDEKPGMTVEELTACIGDYDGLAIRSATKVTPDIVAAASNLKVIGRAGIGVDNVDIPSATARGIAVMNTPFGNSITTAEHAIAMMMALARDIPAADRSTQEGKWEKSRFMGVELTGKTLGIVGCGNIGSIVADRGLGLRMKVIAFDPYLSPERAVDIGVEKVELAELFARSDFITLHTPLTETTRDVINADAIKNMRKGVRIINCARGGLVNEVDAKAALDSGHIGGLALDVFAEEPAKENVLFGTENVVATPHLGASTTEAQENVALQVAEQMADFLIDGAVTNALNMPSVSAEDAPKLRPYIQLAEQLGSFAGQITESGLKGATIEYEGHVSGLNTRPLTAMVVQGLLAPLLDSVNMVNALVMAKERNIEITEVIHDREGDYHTLIRLKVTTEKGTRDLAGTLFADEKPRIVEVNGINVEAELTPKMLFVVNDDKPGFVGSLGAILGAANVNIATFHLGRAEKGESALALVSVDQQIPDELLNDISALPQIMQVKVLNF
jgi:D-3-phosphoglycerate dehydrogenase / 2-oxoglutarate reductase